MSKDPNKPKTDVKVEVVKEDVPDEKKNVKKDNLKKSGKKFYKQVWFYILVGVVLVAIIAIIGYLVFGTDSTTTNSNVNRKTNSKNVARVLDGVMVDPAVANPYPIALMIENLIDVRPQEGLDQAKIIYEALAEGGITRFIALFLLTEPIESVGPVRSARPYYIDWVKEYDAFYGHVGGSTTAMAKIVNESVKDLDQMFNAQYFIRDTRFAAPHNVYTSSDLLLYAHRDKEIPAEGSYESWLYKDGVKKADRPIGEKKIIIDYSSYNYKVEYRYNSESNSYDRYQTDEPFMSSGVHLSPDNVIVQYVVTGLEDASRLTMETIGSGEAVVFRDGQAIQATWEKDSITDRTRYYDKVSDEEIVLNRGVTWISIVPTTAVVEY
ncbi:MAG: DUF3048 domain-containing protein [Patescibacteria group bacterium]